MADQFDSHRKVDWVGVEKLGQKTDSGRTRPRTERKVDPGNLARDGDSSPVLV